MEARFNFNKVLAAGSTIAIAIGMSACGKSHNDAPAEKQAKQKQEAAQKAEHEKAEAEKTKRQAMHPSISNVEEHKDGSLTYELYDAYDVLHHVKLYCEGADQMTLDQSLERSKDDPRCREDGRITEAEVSIPR